MFERYTERARRGTFFARYEASQLGSVSIETEHLLLGLIREGKGLTSRILRARICPWKTFARKSGTHGFPREGVDLGRDSLQRRNQAGPELRGRGSRSAAPQLHRNRTPASRDPARRAERRRLDPHGEGDAPPHRPRGHRPASQREDDANPCEGDAASGGVQPRPHRSGDEESARPAGRS